MNLFSDRFGGQKSERSLKELKSKCQQAGHTPAEALGKNLFPCLFQALELYSLHSSTQGPLFHFQN